MPDPSTIKIDSKDTETAKTEPLSLQEKAMVALGKKLVEESVQVSRDYAKTMIQFSFAAIPIYTTLWKVFSADTSSGKLLVLGFLPNVLFLVSAVLFILSYLPKRSEMVLNVLEMLTDFAEKAVRKRLIANLAGTIMFVGGVIASCIVFFSKIM